MGKSNRVVFLSVVSAVAIIVSFGFALDHWEYVSFLAGQGMANFHK